MSNQKPSQSVKQFEPLSYQTPAICHLFQKPRSNLYMSPGMGKSVVTLTALDFCSLFEDVFPALIVGPLRVANSVWTRECDKWAHLQGLRVSKVLGSAVERKESLAVKADIYTINYDNLAWLMEHLGARWVFKTIVCDESTRTKNHRCSMQKSTTGKFFIRAGGSKNASALIKSCHKADRYHNLTGTPAPNGLKDLWGPQFPIDYGKALGGSFDAFSKRWFRPAFGSTPEMRKIEPLPHAFDEITQRLKPTTLTLNAYDYFDVAKPREYNVDVELPVELMSKYRRLHKEALLKLSEETTITAVNAGVCTAKCLQFATGILYDSNKTAHVIHDLKLQALDSIRENLMGEPLLVAYHWKPDLERILKRFKDAVVLPTGAAQLEVEKKWNNGKIPMLLVHPQSAGHGLDLQYGGCNLAFFSMQWDLELYQQVIERIGPVRQKQAGFDRLVNVARIVTLNTFDTVVAQRLKDKASIQDAISEATKF